ncbi:MAG: hypothetical protein J6N51_13320 [Selenomonas sp.]|nr:hypothetical protein [Selenomonas sp.]
MDTQKMEKRKTSSLNYSLSNSLAQKAKIEMLETGEVKTICPKCKEKVEVTITGMYGERVKMRCSCGFVSCIEYGI